MARQYGDATSTTIHSTIIAGNSATGGHPDFYDGVASITASNNLVGSNSGCGGLFPGGTPNGDGSYVNTASGLSALADNGGPTWTCAVADSSPALDHGSNSAGLATDQRGSGYARSVGTGPDIGAYEYGARPISQIATTVVNY
jgi:hypothetical protein